MAQILDAPSILRAMALYAQALERFRAEIDSLNVFPVPDGDTGTNLLHTQRAVAEAVATVGVSDDGDAREAMTAVRETVAKAALTGARGNSGVILSQVLRTLCAAVPDGGAEAGEVANALSAAAASARGAVGEPREGTVLTVLDTAAAEAHRASAGPAAAAGPVLEAALAGARAALFRTTDQLPELRAAGVVDAGGKGAVLLLDALCAAVTGRDLTEPPGPPGPVGRAGDAPGAPETPALPFPFEVEFLLEGPPVPDVEALRRRLAAMGDSLAIVGGDALYRVHVHTDRPDDVLAAGRAAGAVRDPAVVSLDSQVADCRRGAGRTP